MADRSRSLTRLFASWLKNLFVRPRNRRRLAPSFRPMLEGLETRLAPAALSQTGATLTITLNAQAEQLTTVAAAGGTINLSLNGTNTFSGSVNSPATFTGFGQGSGTLTPTSITRINVVDGSSIHGGSVVFGNSGTQTYTPGFVVTLSDPESANIVFNGSNTFTGNLTATTMGGMVVAESASSSLTVGINLDLESAGSLVGSTSEHTLEFLGTLKVTGSTTLGGNDIIANNPNNAFTTDVHFTADSSINLVNNGPLILGTDKLNVAASNTSTSQITATGDITQGHAFTTTSASGAVVNFTSTTGQINLSNTSNNFQVAIGLGVSGSKAATVFDKGFTDLANITTGTGTLTITSTGTIQQVGSSTITTGGPAIFNVSTNTGSIFLDNAGFPNAAGNNFGGPVTFAETTGGTLQDASLRNISTSAALPTFTVTHTQRNYTLQFDNAAIALPATTITGTLTVTAGAAGTANQAITQTGAISAASGTFAVLGDFGITLGNTSNAITGAVHFDTRHTSTGATFDSSQDVTFVNSIGVVLGSSNLGRGKFNVTAATGNISSGTTPIIQEKGAGTAPFGTATFTATTGTSVVLSAANDFTGNVAIMGNSVTTVTFRNTDALASFANLNLSSLTSLGTLTVQLDNAAFVLPSSQTLTLTNLTITADGIYEATNTSSISVSGQAIFNAGAFAILLGTPSHFANLTLGNSGRNDIVINDTGTINFTGTSNIGSGRLSITAATGITETSLAGIVQGANAGIITLQTGSAQSITLDQSNQLTGAINASSTPSGGNINLSVANSTGDLLLGVINTGSGTLTANASAGNINQVVGTTLAVGGASTFTASGAITLTNQGNAFTSSVALNPSGGDAAITNSGSLTLDNSNLNGNNLTVTAGGTITQAGITSLTHVANGHFDAGTNAITLFNPGNSISSIDLISTGSSAVMVKDTTDLALNQVQLGSGTFTVSIAGNLTETGAITQISPGNAIALTDAVSGNATLGSSTNNLLGTVTVSGFGNVTVTTEGNLTLATSTPITGSLSATASGSLTLPATLKVGSFTASAQNINVGTSITTTSGNATFSGNVSVTGALAFNLANNKKVEIKSGTWSQGGNTLNFTDSSGTITLLIDAGSTFAMASATITMTDGDKVDVAGTFKVGSTPGITLSNGSGTLTFESGSTLEAGLGSPNDVLVKQGTGNVLLGAASTGGGLPSFVGDGVAGTTATPVITAGGGASIIGSFSSSLDQTGAPKPFFAGSDIVTASYLATQTSIGQATSGQGLTLATSGTFNGFTASGDPITINSSLGAGASLVVLQDPVQGFSVVVRGTSALADTLTVTTTASAGTGISQLYGVAVNTTGADTITAASSDLVGNLQTAGTLASLTLHNIGTTTSTLLNQISSAGTGATSITAAVVHNASVNLKGALTSLTAISVDSNSSFSTLSFGTIKTTGGLVFVPGTGQTQDPGNFGADLLSTAPAAKFTATIAGNLSGSWDIVGNVSSVTATSVGGPSSFWNLGSTAGGLANITSLTLGQDTNTNIFASGSLGSLTAVSINTLTGQLASVGSIKTTGSATLADFGDIANLTLTLTGNVGGKTSAALGTLAAAGSLDSASIDALNGNIGTITVGRRINGGNLTVAVGATVGSIISVTAGDILNWTVDAKSLGTLKTTGNLSATLFGDIVGVNFTLHGLTGSTAVALGSLSTPGSINNSILDIQNGNVGTVSALQKFEHSTLSLDDGSTGNLTSITAGIWQTANLIAKTVGSLTVTGVPQAFPRNGFLAGDMTASTIDVYGTNTLNDLSSKQAGLASLGTFKVAGNVSNGDFITAVHGIGTFTVGRGVSGSEIVVDDASSAAPVGLIATLTAGSFSSVTLTANALGKVSIVGYNLPAISSSSSSVPGDVTNSTIVVSGLTPTVSVTSFTVSHDFANSTLTALGNIAALTIKGTLGSTTGSPTIILTDNPLVPAQGAITALTAGEIVNTTIQVGGSTSSAVSAVGNLAFGLLGNITGSTITDDNTSASTPALSTLSAAGNFSNDHVNVPGQLLTFKVAGAVTETQANKAEFAAGYASGKVGSITVGQWNSVDLTSFSVGSFSVTGNKTAALGGTVSNSFFDIFGNLAGVGLGTFSATAAVTNSTFNVEHGNVTSFIVSQFLGSNLLAGVFLPVLGDITKGTPVWDATNRSIGTFKTTGVFNVGDVPDSASFADSIVVAANLGAITLSGVNPTINPLTDSSALTFGVAFRSSTGTQGTVIVNGTTLSPSSVTAALLPDFFYLGLLG